MGNIAPQQRSAAAKSSSAAGKRQLRLLRRRRRQRLRRLRRAPSSSLLHTALRGCVAYNVAHIVLFCVLLPLVARWILSFSLPVFLFFFLSLILLLLLLVLFSQSPTVVHFSLPFNSLSGDVQWGEGEGEDDVVSRECA